MCPWREARWIGLGQWWEGERRWGEGREGGVEKAREKEKIFLCQCSFLTNTNTQTKQKIYRQRGKWTDRQVEAYWFPAAPSGLSLCAPFTSSSCTTAAHPWVEARWRADL